MRGASNGRAPDLFCAALGVAIRAWRGRTSGNYVAAILYGSPAPFMARQVDRWPAPARELVDGIVRGGPLNKRTIEAAIAAQWESDR